MRIRTPASITMTPHHASPNRLILCRRTAFACLAVVLLGCTTIAVVSGPRTVSPGDTATYVLALGCTDTGSDVMLHVAADVPSAWTLLSNSYVGTIGGSPISGSATVVSDPYPGLFPGPGDGFQRLWLEDGPLSAGPADSAELTLEFFAADVPPGEFVLRFWFISSGDVQGSADGRPAVVTVNRQPRLFRFVRSLLQADGALEYNFSVAATADGQTVTLGGFLGPEMAVFDRDPLTGALAHNHDLDDGILDGLDDMVFAPDDRHLYGVHGLHLASFARDPASGQLTMVQLLQDDVAGIDGLMGAYAVAVSPDGASVYAAAYSEGAVSVFDRSAATGSLTFVEAEFDGVGGVVGLSDPSSLAVSQDGANVYLTGSADDAIVAFEREEATGELTFLQAVFNGVDGVTDLDRPWSLAVSPDGAHVYAATKDSHSVAVFARDPGTGELSFVGAAVDGSGDVVGLYGPVDLALSAGGRYVFVSGRGSLVVFVRDAATGELSFLQADFEGEGGVSGIPMPYRLATSADGGDLLYGSFRSTAVFSSRVFGDGFESADTSAWSVTVP